MFTRKRLYELYLKKVKKSRKFSRKDAKFIPSGYLRPQGRTTRKTVRKGVKRFLALFAMRG